MRRRVIASGSRGWKVPHLIRADLGGRLSLVTPVPGKRPAFVVVEGEFDAADEFNAVGGELGVGSLLRFNGRARLFRLTAGHLHHCVAEHLRRLIGCAAVYPVGR